MHDETNYRDLVIKFLAGEISNDEIDLLKSWLEKDPANRKIFDKENELWQKAGLQVKAESFNTEEGWNRLSSSLLLDKTKSGSMVILNRNKFRLLLAAASVAGIVALGGLAFWLSEMMSVKQEVIASTIITTDEGQKAKVNLPDSTKVFLNSGSTLKYDTDYNEAERVVEFSGEGFFDVRTDPEKPLTVQSGDMSVIAAGTRFNVLSYPGERRMETTLEEGKITISIKGEKVIDVKRGQQVVYYPKTGEVIVRDVATETYTSWTENKLRLIDTPFEEALIKIARRYNVTFEIQNRELLDLMYTATFIDESIEDVMQMLRAVSPIIYKIDYRTTVKDREYTKPRIVIRKRN